MRAVSNPQALAPRITEKVRRLNPDEPLSQFYRDSFIAILRVPHRWSSSRERAASHASQNVMADVWNRLSAFTASDCVSVRMPVTRYPADWSRSAVRPRIPGRSALTCRTPRTHEGLLEAPAVACAELKTGDLAMAFHSFAERSRRCLGYSASVPAY